MDDKPFHWKQWIAFGLMCLGLAAGQHLPPTYDVMGAVFVLYFFAGSSWWMYVVDYLEWRRDYRRIVWGSEPPKQIEPEPEPKKYVDLTEKDNVWQSTSEAIRPRDPRWQTFGVAVLNNRPMTQASWTGKGRHFSKTEFVKQMNKWITDQVIVPKKGKGNSGYRPNGASGWQYFKALAEGREWLPLPDRES